MADDLDRLITALKENVLQIATEMPLLEEVEKLRAWRLVFDAARNDLERLEYAKSKRPPGSVKSYPFSI